MREALLEPLLRGRRIRRILPYVAARPNCRVLDIGCGWEARLLKAIEPRIAEGVGIDFKAPLLAQGKIRTERLTLQDRLPFDDARFEVVTMLAVLEHLAQPEAILREVHRVLCPGGALLLTVPSKAARPVLEFLAFRVGLVSRDEIADHKAYYDRASLRALLEGQGLTVTEHRYFQFGMNNFCAAARAPLEPQPSQGSSSAP